jgi:hypothetical protein
VTRGLPPRTTVHQYAQEFFNGVDDLYLSRIRSRRHHVNDERRPAQFIPDGAFRQQLQVMLLLPALDTISHITFPYQGLFDAHPHFAQRFPGGILPLHRLRASYHQMSLKTDACGGC